MKKFNYLKNAAFLILAAAVISVTAYSQLSNSETDAPAANSSFMSCELIQQDTYLRPGIKTTTFMNYGPNSTYSFRAEESAYVKTLNDGMDALNFLAANGWNLATKNMREITNGTETVYVLRKKVN